MCTDVCSDEPGKICGNDNFVSMYIVNMESYQSEVDSYFENNSGRCSLIDGSGIIEEDKTDKGSNYNVITCYD